MLAEQQLAAEPEPGQRATKSTRRRKDGGFFEESSSEFGLTADYTEDTARDLWISTDRSLG